MEGTGAAADHCIKLYLSIAKYEPLKVSKGENTRNRYNQVPHLTQDTNGKVTNSQLDTTNESQEVFYYTLANKKAIINAKNHDDKCFFHAINSALNAVSDNLDRLSKYPYYSSYLKTDDIDFRSQFLTFQKKRRTTLWQ